MIHDLLFDDSVILYFSQRFCKGTKNSGNPGTLNLDIFNEVKKPQRKWVDLRKKMGRPTEKNGQAHGRKRAGPREKTDRPTGEDGQTDLAITPYIRKFIFGLAVAE